jgi:hypothetical protein
VQEPGNAYTVSGTSLIFTEAPAVGDVISVRELQTTSSVTSIQNSSGNAVVSVASSSATVNITGNLIPTGNATQDLGSATNMWKSLYVSGNTIYLGDLRLTASGNTFTVLDSLGNQATIDAGNIDVSGISSGTTTIGINGVNGNIYNTVGGVANVVVVSSTQMSVTGNIVASGDVTAQNVNSLSDAVLKTNINPLSDVDSVINKLFGVEYDWKNGTGHSYGFLAQDVEKVLPEAVRTDDNGLKSVNYMMIIPFLVETIKKLGSEVADLKNRIK